MSENYDGEEQELSAGFIACKACGARIRANRDTCLRCGEPLEAAPQTVTFSTISSGRPRTIALAITAVVVALLALVWVNRPAVEQEAPREGPAAGRVAAPPPASSPAPAPVPAAAAAEPEAVPLPGAAWGDGEDFLEVPHATDADPEGVVARHVSLAEASAKKAEWGRVSSEYRLAAQGAPDSATLRYNLAVAMHRVGDEQSAIAEYQFAIQLAPTQARFHRAMGTSLAKVGKGVEAQQEFEKYLEMDPDAPDAATVRARIAELVASRSSGPP